MLPINNRREISKIRTHSSNANLKPIYKLKNVRFQHKYGRTNSAINLPRMKYNQEKSNSLTYNPKDFFFNNKKYLNDTQMNNFNSILNIQSIEDFLGKTKDPLEKQKELYENMKEEKLKIKNVLSNLISWDNEPTLEEIESFKMLNLDEQNKIIKRLNVSNRTIRINISKSTDNNNDNENKQENNKENNQEINGNRIIGQAMKLIRHKVPFQVIKEINMSKGSQIKEKNLKLTQLKFSVFDKDYDPKKFKPAKKIEKDKKKEEEEKINKFKEKDYLVQFQKQQRQVEMVRRDEIAIIYKNIIINKLKKKKFIEVLDQTYRLLDKARTEYSLSVDILKERIKSVQKYYNAFIVSVDSVENKKTYHTKNSLLHSNSLMESDSEISKRNKIKKTGLDIYEEKIKKYREYLMIV